LSKIIIDPILTDSFAGKPTGSKMDDHSSIRPIAISSRPQTGVPK
jgi:hypothetical protein